MKFLQLKQQAQSILSFKKWGRKNYSSFLTLKKTVVISVLSVVYLTVTPALTAEAQPDTSEIKMQYDLDEIEVSAQRSPAMYSQVARIISVIERKEIEAAPAHSVNDLLEYIAGVDVRQRGAEGVQADVSVRGGTFDQTLILLNGINITDPQTGHHNLNLPVSLSQIDRIEILEGPAARVYGPNAFSGAINIITSQPGRSGFYTMLSGGSFGYFDGNLSANFQTGKMGHLLALGGKRSDGYIENTDFEEVNAYYSNRLVAGDGTLQAQLGFSGKGFGANSFYTPKYPNQYEATKTLFTSVKWEGNSALHLSPVVYYRRHQDRFELFRNNPASWYKNHNHHLTNVYGVNLNSWFQWAAGKTAFGAEFRAEHILSNVLGEDLDNPQDVPGEDAQFTKGDERNTISLFAEHAAYINKWTLTAGFMANSISDRNNGINVFPGMDVSYTICDKLKLYSSYNTSLRMPTFTDLYYNGPTNIGNPHLKPERSATIEGGAKLNSRFVKGHLVLFYRQGKDIIDWVKTTNDDVWQPQNLTQVNNLGSEMQFNFLLREQFGNKYPNINLSYLYNNIHKQEADFISNYVLDNLKHKFVGAIDQKLSKHFHINLKMVYQDREGTYTKYEDKVEVGEVSYEPFLTCDAKLSYSQKSIRIFASVNNLFNVEYNDIGNVIQPGRWIKTGLIYRIGFR